MEKKYKVYKHTFPNGKFYIGITSKVRIEERWGDSGKYYKGQFVYRAIKKYGWDNIKHEILFEDLPKIQAYQKEIELIAFYKSNDKRFGYNIESGGNTRKLMTYAKKKMLSIKCKELIKSGRINLTKTLQSEEAKKKRKESLTKYYEKYGVSEETRQKISKAVKGKTGHKWTDEEKRRASERYKNREFTEEWKRKISQSKQGTKNAMFGKKLTQEHKDKISKAVMKNSKKKRVYCFETNTIYISLSECGRQLGISNSEICKVCKGKRTHVKNYHFKYVD